MRMVNDMDETRQPGHRLLVPLDGSPLATQALPYAQALAAPDAEVFLLYVAPDSMPVADELMGSLMISVSQADLPPTDEEAARQLLEPVAARLRAMNGTLRVEVVIDDGDPAENILRFATDRAVDLIVLASHGRGALGRWVLGSVADRVARNANVPVAIVHPRGDESQAETPVNLKRVIVPLDGSALAARALPVARSFAKRLDLPVVLLSAVDPGRVTSPALAYGGAYSDALFEEIRFHLQNDAERMLAAASDELRDDVAVTNQVLHGTTSGSHPRPSPTRRPHRSDESRPEWRPTLAPRQRRREARPGRRLTSRARARRAGGNRPVASPASGVAPLMICRGHNSPSPMGRPTPWPRAAVNAVISDGRQGGARIATRGGSTLMHRWSVPFSLLAVVLIGMLGASRLATAAAQGETWAASHPVIGSWQVAVTFERQPLAEQPSLITYTAEGGMLVANVGQLPSSLPPASGLFFN